MNERTGSSPAAIRLSLGRKLLFASITVAVFFVMLEGALRLAGLGGPQIVGELQFGYPEGIPRLDSDGMEREGELYRMPLFEEDDRLFWRPIKLTRYTGHNGFRTPEPDERWKYAGQYRLAVLGDSCSFLGSKPYPRRLAERLMTALDAEVDCANASCPGYTSFQGRRRAAELWEWSPDFLIVYFGWNDHWKSLNGLPDAEVAQRRERLSVPQSMVQNLHLVRLMRQLLPATRVPTPVDDAADAPVRVPLAQYRENLHAIVEEALAQGCQVALVVAPTTFHSGQMPAWAQQFFGSQYKMSSDEVDAIPEVHAQYAGVVRDIAEAYDNVMIVDAAGLWGAEPSDRRFRRDRIHLTQAGHDDLGDLIFDVWSAHRQASSSRSRSNRSANDG